MIACHAYQKHQYKKNTIHTSKYEMKMKTIHEVYEELHNKHFC